MVVAYEKPETFIPKLIAKDRSNYVVYQQEICDEELTIEAKVMLEIQKKAKSEYNVNIDKVWGSTLHHLDDLSYDPVDYLPHIYGKFREKNAGVPVRPLLKTPEKDDLPFAKGFKEGIDYLPKLSDFGFSKKRGEKCKNSNCFKHKKGWSICKLHE